jgi:hypothetical protein
MRNISVLILLLFISFNCYADTVSIPLCNADFEYPDLNDGKWFKHIYGWESWFSDYSAERCPEVRDPAGGLQASSGENYGFFNSVQLFQLPATIESGKTYSLQVDVSQYGSYTGVFRFGLGAYDSADKYDTQPDIIDEATQVTHPLTGLWQTISLQFNSDDHPEWIGYPLLVYLWSDKVGVDNVVLTKTADSADVVELSVSAPSGGEAGVWPGVGLHQYEIGDEIKLTAMKYEQGGVNYVFDHWVGDVEYKYQPETTITMDSNKSIEAVYVESDGDPWDVKADTWVATDALGRELPGYEECGPVRENRHFICAYTFWLATAPGMYHEPYDVTALMAEDPYNPDWGFHYAFHFWGEPELGYYKSVDDYVMRKHIYMFDAAGVDVLAFENTNAATYPQANMILCDVMEDLKAKGTEIPDICFWTNPNNNIEQDVYLFFYSQNLYSDMWFYLDGKPLIMPVDDWSGLNNTLKNYFTFRQCWDQLEGQHMWQSGDFPPQDYGWNDASDKPEQTSVAAARHATTNVGRSYHNGSQPPIDEYHNTGLQDQGLYLAEQFERALELDPEFIFNSTWNEWGSFRYIYPEPVWPGLDHFLGHQMVEGETWFGDDYNHEYSRDIDPMKDGHTDNYYYQMVANIRRYKGVRAPDVPSGPVNVDIDGNFAEWATVEPEYRDYKRDIMHRDELGWGDFTRYVNTTGRNDFVITKVAYDDNYVYFYAETMHPITPFTDTNWMLLYIDADMNHSTGWEGYDYLINESVANSSLTTLKSSSGGTAWTTVRNDIAYSVSGNKLEIKVPRSSIGQTGGNVAFDFHWADNIQQHFDVIEFAVNGDSAPDRRFNYRYDSSIRDFHCQRLFEQGGSKEADLNDDCYIDIKDASLFALDWLNLYDLKDFSPLAVDWQADYAPEQAELQLVIDDGFETGDFSGASWSLSGHKDWVVSSDNIYDGSYSGKSGDISDNQQSSLSIQVDLDSDAMLSFHYRVSTEQNYDYLRFYVDSSLEGSFSGDEPWMLYKISIPPGNHTLKWTYDKDSSVSSYDDCVWIDNILLTEK